MSEIKTTHNLPFLQAGQWYVDPQYIHFKVGTVTGLYRFAENSIDILGITNEESGNGHVRDVFEWFEFSCKHQKKPFLKVLECWNVKLREMCLKNGFTEVKDTDNLQKQFIIQ